MKKNVKTLIGLIGAGVLAVLPAAPVSAHAEMTKSSPANGATLASAPNVIQAWFSDELTSSGTYLRLYDGHNKLLATGGLDPKVSSHKALRLAPPRLSPGAYLVRWHVVSADDNHVTQGYFRFSVAGTAMASSMTVTSFLPTLQLVAPMNHSTVTNPVAVVIETPGDIKELTLGGGMSGMQMSTGSMAGPGAHLHILVDGVMTMPSSDQLTAAGNQRYQYVLAPLSPGTHTVSVSWADNKTHAPVGPVDTATFTVTP